MTGNTDVVVIGGGYAGVMAANRLTQRDDVTVTLINPRPSFVERIRLHQLVGGSNDAVADFRDVLADGVRLVVDAVTSIDAAGRKVALAAGGTVGYDYLIYAVGSGSADPRVPGAAEFAYPIATLEAAERLRVVVEAAPPSAAVTVVGAGPTGIETAAGPASIPRPRSPCDDGTRDAVTVPAAPKSGRGNGASRSARRARLGRARRRRRGVGALVLGAPDGDRDDQRGYQDEQLDRPRERMRPPPQSHFHQKDHQCEPAPEHRPPVHRRHLCARYSFAMATVTVSQPCSKIAPSRYERAETSLP